MVFRKPAEVLLDGIRSGEIDLPDLLGLDREALDQLAILAGELLATRRLRAATALFALLAELEGQAMEPARKTA
jgi:hypothetical protein